MHHGKQVDLSAYVERVKRRTRPWKSIAALLLASGRIPAEKMGTHSFTFAQMDVFKNAAENSALKAVITPA